MAIRHFFYKMNKVKTIISIDPGANGGICRVKNYNNFEIKFELFPLGDFDKNSKTLIPIIKECQKEQIIVFLEEVSSRPGQSSVATFTFGKNYGFLYGFFMGWGFTNKGSIFHPTQNYGNKNNAFKYLFCEHSNMIFTIKPHYWQKDLKKEKYKSHAERKKELRLLAIEESKKNNVIGKITHKTCDAFLMARHSVKIMNLI